MKLPAASFAAILLLAASLCAARYFIAATLVSTEHQGSDQWYTIEAPTGVYLVREHWTRKDPPHVLKGEIRVAIEDKTLYFLDQDGKEHKTRIEEKQPPRAPRPAP